MRITRKVLFTLVAVLAFVNTGNAGTISTVLDFIDRSQISYIKRYDYNSQNAALVTAGLQKAFDAGVGYMPAGTYRTNDDLIADNINVRGEGLFQTYIIGDIADASTPVIRLCRSAQLRDCNIQFATTRITGTETAGQRVGIVTGAEGKYQLQRGGGIYNVRIEHVGTAISDLGNETYCPFSGTYDTIEIENPSYRGLDFRTYQRTGNCYRNIYISGGDGFGTENSAYMNNQECGFNLSGQEAEASIDQINVEWGHWATAMRFNGVSAASIGTLHIEQVTLKNNYATLIEWNRSAGRINALGVYYCPINTTGWAVIGVQDAQHYPYSGAANPNTASQLSIGVINTVGLNDGLKVLSNKGLTSRTDFNFVRRELAAVGDFYMWIDATQWNTFQSDTAVYTAWPKDPHSKITWY